MRFYRINVSGTKFFLSENNIRSDSPNLFMNRFEKEFSSKDNVKTINQLRMAVDRCPIVFEYIQRHLQGYNVDVTSIPIHLVRHVKEDAEYYGLEKLKQRLEGKGQHPMFDIKSDYLPLVSYDSSIDSKSNGSDDGSEIDSDADEDTLLDFVNEKRMVGGRFLENVKFTEYESDPWMSLSPPM
jgi:hypothetical protein